MKALLRKVLAWLFLPLAWLTNRLRPGVRVLMYHRIDDLPEYDQLTVGPALFRQQMAWLSRHRRVVPLSQALTELASGTVRPDTVVVTFDDGYRDNLTHALPVLKEFGLPATVFITTGFAGGSIQHPRYAPTEALHMHWDDMADWLGHQGNEIGAHSRTHPYLSQLDERACADEIGGCLEDFSEHQVSHNAVFCYPSGDMTTREANLARQAGYSAAVTVAPGINRPGEDPYFIKRTEITDRDQLPEFRLKLSGAFDFIHALLHWRRKRNFARAAAGHA